MIELSGEISLTGSRYGCTKALSLLYSQSIKTQVLITQNNIFDTRLLRQLIRSGKTGELVARGVPGGFVLAMRDGLDEQILFSQRGRHRVFRRLDAVAAFLRKVGGQEFVVELGHWEPAAPALPL